MSRISQREARQLRRRVQALERVLEAQRGNWNCDWPGGTFIGCVRLPEPSTLAESVRVSRLLGHAVVATQEAGQLRFFALPLPSAPAVKS